MDEEEVYIHLNNEADNKRYISNVVEAPKDLLKLPPWAKRKYKKGDYCLAEELEDFVKYIELTKEEYMVRKELIHRIKLVVTSCYPEATCEVFGSFETNLQIPSSDIDIVVLGVSPSRETLNTVSQAMVRMGICKKPFVLSKARVPIVKLYDNFTGVRVDISFDEIGGVENTKVVKSLIKKYTALRKLVLLIKYFVMTRGLNETFSGGLGSYATCLMVASFLQQHPYTDLESGATDDNIGHLLIDFFDLYGRTFNYVKTGLSVKDGIYYDKYDRDMYDYDRPYLLSIEDPANIYNDVGKNTYRILNIRQAFRNAYDRLSKHPTEGEYAPTLLSRVFDPDPSIEENRKYIKRIHYTLVNSDLFQFVEKDSRKEKHENSSKRNIDGEYLKESRRSSNSDHKKKKKRSHQKDKKDYYPDKDYKKKRRKKSYDLV